MKAIFYTTAAALIAIANPASAQILGGGGSGGILGGGSMPSLPSMPEPMRMPSGPVGTVTNGSGSGSATATATKTVNPRTGKASANGSSNGSATGALTQTIDTPRGAAAASGAGSGSAGGSAGADAQLFGTDAVRGTLHQTRDTAGNTVTAFQNRAGNLVTATRDRAGNLIVSTRDRAGNLVSATGSATGSAQGSATSSFSGMSHNLALAGSAAADASGSFDIKDGTSLYDLNGEKIGKVREVFADGSGRVKGLLVKTDDTTALLPVSEFAAGGQGLVTAMSEAQIEATGEGQAGGGASGSASSIFSGLSHNLALSGSSAADLAGSFDVKPGTQLFNMADEKVGKVKEVIADGNGRVRALVVQVKDHTATLPAADFAANGDVLVTAMSQAQILATQDKPAAGTATSQQSTGAARAAGASRSGAPQKGPKNNDRN